MVSPSTHFSPVISRKKEGLLSFADQLKKTLRNSHRLSLIKFSVETKLPQET